MPAWAEEFRRIFRAGTVSQYVLYGSLFDLVPYRQQEQQKFAPLREFLANVLFAPFEVVLSYNRSAGLKAVRG